MADFTTARRMMVDGQVRPNDVTDIRIISAFMDVPRERFVPAEKTAIAYLDMDVQLTQGAEARFLLKPMLLAKMIQVAGVREGDNVLNVGSATGYSSAILSKIAGSVVALEPNATLATQAAENLRAVGASGVTAAGGPFLSGWPAQSPYDVIIVNGATEVSLKDLCKQLADGGRLICVQGSGPGAKATLYTRSGDDVTGRPVFDASAPVLPGLHKVPEFAF